MVKIRNKQLSITEPFDINNQRLINVADPINQTDVPNKNYVDTTSINYATQTGLYSGGTLSIDDGSHFTINAGIGFFVDPTSKIITKVEWDTINNIESIPYGTTDITISVAIDENGDVFQQIPKFTTEQRRNYIILGEIFIEPNDRILIDCAYNPIFSWDIPSVVDMHLSDNPKSIEGNTILPNGQNLQLDATSGKMIGYSINAKQSLNNPNQSTQIPITGITFYPSYYNGLEWVYLQSSNIINPGLWSNGTNTLQTTSNNKFSLRVLFRSNGIGDVFFLTYPTQEDQYSSIEEAESKTLLMGIPQPSELFGITIPIAWIILKGNATDLSDPLQSKIIPIKSVSSSTGSIATNASDVSYDPTTTTNIISTNVQDALDEVNDKIESLNYNTSNLNMLANSGNTNIYLATDITVLETPKSRVRVYLNSVEIKVGDGITTSECYFSDDNGVTAKNYDNVEIGDELYWNYTTTGYHLDNDDEITYNYLII